MSETIRSFIAIALPAQVHSYLADIQSELKKCRADVKWAKPQNIHLTLKFLGNINTAQRSRLEKALGDIASRNERFETEISALGAFPKIEYPRVVWMGVEKNKERIEKIAAEIEDEAAHAGIEKEGRGFTAHLTLGRVNSDMNRAELTEKLKNISLAEKPAFPVGKLTLLKSTLTPSGPVYEALSEHNLKTN